jgi:hypothetical protein
MTGTAKVIQVIVTTCCRGRGTEESLSRTVHQYWDFDGRLLAESDPVYDEMVREQMVKDILP